MEFFSSFLLVNGGEGGNWTHVKQERFGINLLSKPFLPLTVYNNYNMWLQESQEDLLFWKIKIVLKILKIFWEEKFLKKFFDFSEN